MRKNMDTTTTTIFKPLVKSLKEFFGEGHKVCVQENDGIIELSVTTHNPEAVKYARERKKFATPTILVIKLEFKIISGEKLILTSWEWNELADPECSEFWGTIRDIVVEFLFDNRDKITVPQGGE